MAGLTSAAQQEASKNIAEEQLKQAQKAQQAQLLGTGLGIAGAYGIMQGAGTAAAITPLASAVPGGAAAATAAANPTAAALGLGGGGTAAAGSAGATLTGQAAAGGTAAGAGTAGGATALLANPMTWAVIAGLYLLKKVF
jgi:hypothetical protein